jgi:hypothetical protein
MPAPATDHDDTLQGESEAGAEDPQPGCESLRIIEPDGECVAGRDEMRDADNARAQHKHSDDERSRQQQFLCVHLIQADEPDPEHSISHLV